MSTLFTACTARLDLVVGADPIPGSKPGDNFYPANIVREDVVGQPVVVALAHWHFERGIVNVMPIHGFESVPAADIAHLTEAARNVIEGFV